MATKEGSGWGFYTKFMVYLLIGMGVVFCLMPMSWMQKVYEQDRRWVERQLGEETLDSIELKTSDWFKRSIVDTGFCAGGYALCSRNPQDSFDDRGLGALFAQRLDVFWVAVRQMVFRYYVWLVWLPCLIIFVPMVIDAYLHWQIRKNRSSSFSATLYSQAKRAFVVLLGCLLLGPVIPWQIPPMAVPVALGLLAVTLWIWLAHLPKRV